LAVNPSTRRERKRVHMLDHLASTAFCLFESRGYESVTMEQIATEADVAKGTLYKHFPIKEALLAHWIHVELATDLQCLLADGIKRMSFAPAVSLVLDASADWCEKHRQYLPHYLRFRFLNLEAPPAAQDNAAPSDMAGAFEVLIGRGQRSGELRMDLAATHLAGLFHHLYFGALLRWLMNPGLVLREEFAAVIRLFIDGAAYQPAPTRRSGPQS
jgi:TetR/AcrR family transcriptional regulator, regulator of autoinduction and epiphytic fitness